MSNYQTKVSAPVINNRDITKPLMCGPGPSDLWPSVAEALCKPVISPICEEYFKVIDDIREGLKYLFQTRCPTVFAVSGSGNSGMETVISNLVAPGETMLIAMRGMWDERAYEMSVKHGLKTIITKIPLNQTFSLEHLEAELRKHRPTALFITHGDSSTGTIQKLEGLGDICHRYGTLLLVDTVAAVGGVPFFMDDWGVDGAYASTQKALSGPAGISSVAFSQRALDKINNRTHEPPFYFDAKLLAEQWYCYGTPRRYHHTLSPPLLWALRECLQVLINETLPASWARHASNTAHFHKRLQEHNFKFFVPNPEDRLITVTTIGLPEGYSDSEFSKHMRTNYNILIFPGLGPTVGKALRIGLMGYNSRKEVADALVDAMVMTLRDLSKKFQH